MYKRPARILFLCTGNACRSQMAEGFANAWGSTWLEARSAGIEAHGQNPDAITAMAAIGIDISNQESVIVSEDMLNWADLIITVCEQADDQCPVIPSHCQKKHWPFPDPAKMAGSDIEIRQHFAEVRDAIGKRVRSMINGMQLMAKSDSRSLS